MRLDRTHAMLANHIPRSHHMPLHPRRIPDPVAAALLLALLAPLSGCTDLVSGANDGGAEPSASRGTVPVEIAAIERGPITARRTVSGSLEAAAEFVVAAKVGGRVAELEVEIGDTVERGAIVARLDDDEFGQAVLQAEADLAVARANHVEARSALEISTRALTRLEALLEEGVSSEAQLDDARSRELASRSRLEVTAASIANAEAALLAARVRLGYVTVAADWNGDDELRVVGERFVDEGGNVPPNTPLLSIIRISPIIAVVSVAERDYRGLSLDQRAVLTTDAYPGREFSGKIVRIAPIFNRATRQARVELELANPDGALKPGMFVRATLELDHVDDAIIVPSEALTERADSMGLFVLADGAEKVRWVPVEVGLRGEQRLQVVGEDLQGSVVVLGQELCDDGASVHIVGNNNALAP